MRTVFRGSIILRLCCSCSGQLSPTCAVACCGPRLPAVKTPIPAPPVLLLYTPYRALVFHHLPWGVEQSAPHSNTASAMASAAAAPVRRIVITGGPCSGKTSVLPVLDKALRSKGWEVWRRSRGLPEVLAHTPGVRPQVYLVPEIPTILQSGGAKYPGPDAGERLMQFESALVRMQLAAEESFAQVCWRGGVRKLRRASLPHLAWRSPPRTDCQEHWCTQRHHP